MRGRSGLGSWRNAVVLVVLISIVGGPSGPVGAAAVPTGSSGAPGYLVGDGFALQAGSAQPVVAHKAAANSGATPAAADVADRIGCCDKPPAPPPPANDHFANAQAIGLPGMANGSTLSATVQTGEGSCCGGGKSVWFTFTPTTSGALTATTAGSQFDTVLSLYSGSSLATLTELACSDDYLWPNTLTSRLQAPVTAGTTYYLRLAGFIESFGALAGNYTLQTSLTPAPTPTAVDRGSGRVTGVGAARAAGPGPLGQVAFTTILTDPTGDQLVVPGGPTVDIRTVEAGTNTTATVLEVRVTLVADINTAMPCIGGYVELDTDQNRFTGRAAVVNPILLASQDVGVDFSLNLANIPAGGGVIVENSAHGFVGAVPATVSGRTVEIRVPLSLLGNDDGNMDVGVAMGFPGWLTDAAPSNGHGTIGTAGPPGVIGGHGFTLQGGSGPQLSWTGGTLQTNYLIVRWDAISGAFAFLGGQWPTFLPGGMVSFQDVASLTDATYCYLLVPFAGSLDTVLGVSDFHCIYPNTRSGAFPRQFAVRLNESSTASLSWAPPSGGAPTGYELRATRFDGSPPRIITRDATQLTYSEDIGFNNTTCYELMAKSGAATTGQTDKLCTIAGIAQKPGGANVSLGASLDRLRSAFGGR